MRHISFGKKLSRSTNARKRLLRNLAHDLFVHGSIKTTIAKAKAVQPLVEKLITKAKKGKDVASRMIMRVITDSHIVHNLIEDTKTRFSKRTSGFTRITKIGYRAGDASEQVLLSFVDPRVVQSLEHSKIPNVPKPPGKKEKGKPEKKTEKPLQKKKRK